MKTVFIYSVFLLAGAAVSQFLDIASAQGWLRACTMICLGYIMIEVGLEFRIDKKNLKSYGWDYIVAMTAATLPWIFCAIYFLAVLGVSWKEAFIIGRFAAPTSAGVLFAMLLGAGLGTTWLFKKVRVLAIFDDLDTIILMIPLQMMIVGAKPELFVSVAIITVLLMIAYRQMHHFRLPVGKFWIFYYAVMIFTGCWLFEHLTHIHFEILLPAFVFGCVLFNPHARHHADVDITIEYDNKLERRFDRIVKVIFMFMVGCSLPKIQLQGIGAGTVAIHVIMLTILSNIGKCFPILCYRKQVTFRERIAVAVSMFPRGEVGAGVLLVTISLGITGTPIAIAGLSLILNLMLTGFFIWGIFWLLKHKKPRRQQTRMQIALWTSKHFKPIVKRRKRRGRKPKRKQMRIRIALWMSKHLKIRPKRKGRRSQIRAEMSHAHT